MRRAAYFSTAILSLAACGAPDDPSAVASGDLSRAASLAAVCSGCHTALGGEALVSLAALSADEIRASFRSYRDDDALQTVMHRVARGYDDADIDLIAEYLAASGAD
ncbi:MAG: hypothetical protein AAF719_06605 [Pseudomonadota bacterium]